MKEGIIRKKMNSFDKIYLVCMFIITLYLIFPLFSYNFCNLFSALYIYVFIFLLVSLLISRSLLLKRSISKDIIISKQIIYSAIWCILYILVLEFVQKEYIAKTIYVFSINSLSLYVFLILIISFISDYFLRYNNAKIYKIVIMVSLICLFISAVISITILRSDPLAARNIFNKEMGLMSYYYRIGFAGYGITYSIPVLFPMLIGGIFELKGIRRALMILFCILLVYYIYLTAFITALVGILFGVITLFLFKLPKILRIFSILITFILSVIFSTTNVLYCIFLYVSQLIDVKLISSKLYDIANSLHTGKAMGTVLSRTYRYNLSLEGFNKSPLLGIYFLNPNYVIGGHATFLDILASTGLIGFVFFALWLWYTYKAFSNKWRNTRYLVMFQSSFLVFIMFGFTKSIITSTAIFFTLLFLNPGVAYLIEDMK